jgi:Na+/melibiose symporter-like transporter
MENNDTNKTKNQLPSDKISFGQLAAYGSGGIIPIALFNVAGILVGLMGNISLGLSAFWLGLILIIPRLWDALSDPIIGHFPTILVPNGVGEDLFYWLVVYLQLSFLF